MNEGQFIALRSYGEGNQALLQQILDELKTLNSKLGAPTKEAATVDSDKAEKKPATAKGKPKVTPKVGWNT